MTKEDIGEVVLRHLGPNENFMVRSDIDCINYKLILVHYYIGSACFAYIFVRIGKKKWFYLPKEGSYGNVYEILSKYFESTNIDYKAANFAILKESGIHIKSKCQLLKLFPPHRTKKRKRNYQ